MLKPSKLFILVFSILLMLMTAGCPKSESERKKVVTLFLEHTVAQDVSMQFAYTCADVPVQDFHENGYDKDLSKWLETIANEEDRIRSDKKELSEFKIDEGVALQDKEDMNFIIANEFYSYDDILEVLSHAKTELSNPKFNNEVYDKYTKAFNNWQFRRKKTIDRAEGLASRYHIDLDKFVDDIYKRAKNDTKPDNEDGKSLRDDEKEIYSNSKNQ